MKVLISWMSKASDFRGGQVNEVGPNHTFHKYFYSHGQHILLNSEKGGDTALEFLLNTLKRKYPDRTIEAKYLGINDVIDLEEVLPKMRTVLLEYRNDEIDIFFFSRHLYHAIKLVYSTLHLRPKNQVNPIKRSKA